MMLCSKCYSNNSETSRFCVQCGAIADRSIKCGFDNIPEARPCGRCVAPNRIFEIDDSSKTDNSTSEKQSRARGIRDDERRHLTFLYSDPVGSITLAAQVDSEEWRQPIATGDLKALLDELSISGGGEH
jgi:hypothetical protein